MFDFDSVRYKWGNCWRFAFICMGLAFFFMMCSVATHHTIPFYHNASHFLGVLGGICFVVLCVVRFDDVIEFMNNKSPE